MTQFFLNLGTLRTRYWCVQSYYSCIYPSFCAIDCYLLFCMNLIVPQSNDVWLYKLYSIIQGTFSSNDCIVNIPNRSNQFFPKGFIVVYFSLFVYPKCCGAPCNYHNQDIALIFGVL